VPTVYFLLKDPAGEFYIIFNGSVKIYTTGTNGEEKILTMCKTGESFGEMSLIDGKPRSASAKTLEDCTLITVTGDRFLGLLREHSTLLWGLCVSLAIVFVTRINTFMI
jgi:CRP/FNR family transcriptional regulator/CRP/FNR family cyclic AMP-dependent transcriptional regulator